MAVGGGSPATRLPAEGPRALHADVDLRRSLRRFDASPEDQVLLGVEYGDLGDALARLSPEMRAVVQATVLDGLTTREAAPCSACPGTR